MATVLHSDVSRAGSTCAWSKYRLRHHAALLVDARALPCAAMERLGVGSIVRSGGYDGSQLPRQADRCACRQTTEALAREFEQASGEGTQDIDPRFGVVARTAQSRDAARFGGSSQAWCIVGGLRH